MKKPEDIPQEIVAKFASALGHEYSDAAICQHTAQDVRNALAAVWDEIWAFGFTDGFSTKIEAEQ